jgi:hypothetical protein
MALLIFAYSNIYDGHGSRSLRKPGSWARIPHKARMFDVCVYSVFLLSCVSVEALRRADRSSKEFYRL